MSVLSLPRVKLWRVNYSNQTASECGINEEVYCSGKWKNMALIKYDLSALQTERAGRQLVISRVTASWYTSAKYTYNFRIHPAPVYSRWQNAYFGDATGTKASLHQISRTRYAENAAITYIQDIINGGASEIYASCENEKEPNGYGECRYFNLEIEYEYASPLTVIDYLIADKTTIALGESVDVVASVRNTTESEISAVQLQVVREVDGADVAVGDPVTVDVTIPAAETEQIHQTLTVPAWADAARATQLYVKVTIVDADAEKTELCTALDKRYNPTIETFNVSRAAQHPINGWIKSDNGMNTMTDVKIDLGSGASGFTLKVYYGTGEIDTSTAASIDLTSRISDAIAGLIDETELIEKTGGWALGSAWNFLLVLSDSYESARMGASIDIAFTNMHLAGLSTGGVRFGGYCTRSAQDNPAFECDYPIYADGGIPSLDYSTTETKMPYKWIDGKDVYRMVCTTTDSSAWSGGEVVFPAISDAETIVSITGTWQWSNGRVDMIPYMQHTDMVYSVYAYFGDDKVPRVKLSYVYDSITRITLIVEYTKGDA